MEKIFDTDITIKKYIKYLIDNDKENLLFRLNNECNGCFVKIANEILKDQ